ncbi:ATP-binding protein [Bifidobacterium pullorum]|uniref:ATP-binding protein n=1 Tax=Bifidobacterium pullorum TaxID=78448 RepID=UPI003D18CE54
MPQGHPRPVLHRLRPDHAPAQGQIREQARPGTQDHRQGRPAHHRTGPATCPSTSTAPGSCPRIIADSYERRSIIFTSNLEFGRWGDVFGDGDMAAAVIDRIVHHGRIIRFHGESYRNTHSLMK